MARASGGGIGSSALSVHNTPPLPFSLFGHAGLPFFSPVCRMGLIMAFGDACSLSPSGSRTTGGGGVCVGIISPEKILEGRECRHPCKCKAYTALRHTALPKPPDFARGSLNTKLSDEIIPARNYPPPPLHPLQSCPPASPHPYLSHPYPFVGLACACPVPIAFCCVALVSWRRWYWCGASAGAIKKAVRRLQCGTGNVLNCESFGKLKLKQKLCTKSC